MQLKHDHITCISHSYIDVWKYGCGTHNAAKRIHNGLRTHAGRKEAMMHEEIREAEAAPQKQTHKGRQGSNAGPGAAYDETAGHGGPEDRRQQTAAKKGRQVELGLWLYSHRRALGLTQKQAAGLARLSANTWSQIEAGNAGTRYDTVPRLAAAVQADCAQAYRLAGFAPPEGLTAPQESGEGQPYGQARPPSSGRAEVARAEEAPAFDMAAWSVVMSALATQGQMIASLEARVARLEGSLERSGAGHQGVPV
jgi:transcriptional regulator with XRE-family HTH domain